MCIDSSNYIELHTNHQNIWFQIICKSYIYIAFAHDFPDLGIDREPLCDCYMEESSDLPKQSQTEERASIHWVNIHTVLSNTTKSIYFVSIT